MKMPKTDMTYIPFAGGLDQVTPPVQVNPGFLLESSNFDVGTNGGYRRIDGYEKWDGSTLPNEYGYFQVLVASTAAINIGRTLVGETSGATGLVIQTDNDGYVYFVRPTGTFAVGETVTILGSPVGSVVEEPYQRKDRSTPLSALCMALSANEYRKDIQTVPGSGAIRGIVYYEGALYAFRNRADNSATGIYKSSTSGWVEITLSNQVSFTAASGDLVEGQTLTQSGRTAVIQRVVIESGSLGSGTAAGRLIVANPVGGNLQAGAAATPEATLTLEGAQTAITLNPNGRFRFFLSNFGAGQRIYGCSGTDNAFEFDGEVLVPIRTGMALDRPSHVVVHKNHLFLAFDNSLQFSAIGDPYNWTPLLGAGELNMGETITNLLSQPSDSQSGGALAVSTRNSLAILYGTSAADWQLVTLQRDVGSFAHTMQAIAADTYFLDDRGISSMSGVQEFGNFASSTISQLVRPWLMERKVNILDSCVVKDKNQYRLFFGGGTGMHITFLDRRPVGFMPVQYAHSMVVALSTEMEDGADATFYGDDQGNVYLADNGPSFAGETITAYFKLHYNHCQSPRVLKQFRRVTFEVKGSGYSDFQVGSELGYGDGDIPLDPIELVDAQFTGPKWDTPGSFWDAGVWDGRILLPVEVSLQGQAENVSLTVYQSSDRYESLNFQGALLQFTARRLKR